MAQPHVGGSRLTRRRTSSVATALQLAGAALGILASAGCVYVQALRPSVLSQLSPPLMRLVNYLPELDHPNDALVGRLFAQGGLAHARMGPDGVMRADVRVRQGAVMWEPSILVLPRGGTIEVVVTNEDENAHIAFFPSNGASQVLVLPPHTAGRLRATLDDPGLYTFAEGAANHAGRGMLGVLIVEGNVVPDARLDRPPQPRPHDE